MQNRVLTIGTAVAFAIVAAFSWAQAEGETEAGAEDPNEPAADTAAPVQPPPPSADTPLEDYESSEQISEDLSVSFPIDI